MVTKFSGVQVYDEVPEGSSLISVDAWISLTHTVRLVQRSLHAKNQLDLSTRFDRTPTCDGQTSYSTTTAETNQARKESMSCITA